MKFLPTIKPWEQGACWLHPDFMPGSLSSLEREPGSHEARSVAGRKGHLREYTTLPSLWGAQAAQMASALASGAFFPYAEEKLPWTPPASRMFLFRGLCKTDGENKKGKWKQEGTSVSSRAGWRVLCLSEEILVPMDCTRLAAEFLVFAVDAITCSSCCYHRNHTIHLKVYINNIVTWLWFWKLTPFNFAWFILYTLFWRYFHQ